MDTNYTAISLRLGPDGLELINVYLWPDKGIVVEEVAADDDWDDLRDWQDVYGDPIPTGPTGW